MTRPWGATTSCNDRSSRSRYSRASGRRLVLAYRRYGSTKVGRIGKDESAALTLPADEDDRQDLHGQRDEDTDLASPQFMLLESLGRIATETPFTIAHVLGNRRLVLLDGSQDWRRGGDQVDDEIGFLKEGRACCQDKARSSFFMRAPPRQRRASRKDARRRASGGLGRVLLSQILRD